jgi:hypothetical protein
MLAACTATLLTVHEPLDILKQVLRLCNAMQCELTAHLTVVYCLNAVNSWIKT